MDPNREQAERMLLMWLAEHGMTLGDEEERGIQALVMEVFWFGYTVAKNQMAKKEEEKKKNKKVKKERKKEKKKEKLAKKTEDKKKAKTVPSDSD